MCVGGGGVEAKAIASSDPSIRLSTNRNISDIIKSGIRVL